MPAQQVVLTKDQTKALKGIIAAGRGNHIDFDGRSVLALSKRELVKVTESKKGKFVSATAKGRKHLN